MNSDVVFALENAGWPALLVDSAGTIQRVNQAGASALAGPIREGTTPLSFIWSKDNISGATDFLESAGYAMASHSLLKFLSKDGASMSFLTYAAPLVRGQNKYFVL